MARDSSGCPPLRKKACTPSKPYTPTTQRTSESLPRSSTRAKTYRLFAALAKCGLREAAEAGVDQLGSGEFAV